MLEMKNHNIVHHVKYNYASLKQMALWPPPTRTTSKKLMNLKMMSGSKSPPNATSLTKPSTLAHNIKVHTIYFINQYSATVPLFSKPSSP